MNVAYVEIPLHNHFRAVKADIHSKIWTFLMGCPLDAH
jgi:hypothetical protein